MLTEANILCTSTHVRAAVYTHGQRAARRAAALLLLLHLRRHNRRCCDIRCPPLARAAFRWLYLQGRPCSQRM